VGSTSGYHNLKSEGARNRCDTFGLRAMIDPKRLVRKGAFGREFPVAHNEKQRDVRIASRAEIHR